MKKCILAFIISLIIFTGCSDQTKKDSLQEQVPENQQSENVSEETDESGQAQPTPIKSENPQPSDLVVNNSDTINSGTKSAPTEISIKDPEIKDPEIKDIKIKDPEIEEPKITEPIIEEPKTTEPKIKDPEIEDPKITEPTIEEPSVKDNLNVIPVLAFEIDKGNAYCMVNIEEDSAYKITGSLILEQKNKDGTFSEVKKWDKLKSNSNSFWIEKSHEVSLQKTYRLSFSGKVYTKTKVEKIDISQIRDS